MVLDKGKWFSGLIAGLFILSSVMLNRQMQQPIVSGAEPLPHFRLETLPLFSFGHQALVSDLLMARGLSYYGAHRATQGDVSFSRLKDLFSMAFALDPQNRELILLGANLLVGYSLKDALSLLQEGMQRHPEYWKFPEMSGFLNYYYAKEPIVAAKFYERAARLPGHPPFVPSISSKLYEEGGFFKQAVDVLKNLALESKDERVRQSFEERIGEIEARLQSRRFRVPVVLHAVVSAFRLHVEMKRFNPYNELGSVFVVDLSETFSDSDACESWLLTAMWRMRLGQEIWIQLDTDESGKHIATEGAWKGSWLGDGGETLLPRAMDGIKNRRTLGQGDTLEEFTGQFVRICGHALSVKTEGENLVVVWKETGLPPALISKVDRQSFSNYDWSQWINENLDYSMAVNALLSTSESGNLVLPLIHPDQIEICRK